jgi:hypothetical protein
VEIDLACETERPEQTDPKVLNLSDKILTESEINLLSKGLKYTPTPTMNNQELRTDLKEYTRRLKLKEFFNEDDTEFDETPLHDSQPEQEDLVRNKSNFLPKRGRNKTLYMICDTIENIQLPNTSSKTKCNFSKKRKKPLKT